MKTGSKTIYKGELLNLYDISPDSEDLFDGVIVEYMIIPDGKGRHQIFIDRATFDNVIKELPKTIANYKRYRVKYPKWKS
ncbi:hypothetical protein AYK25_08160 [Thermoplasmatales archaeon SM1-50]|nr:MAG: hypothetical protein AYK25_08160 [Thermoplasmatales archaeon SM1-50]